jgi:hypothetical protein
MAVCDYCQQEMENIVGCTLRQFPGEPKRIPATDRDGLYECDDCLVPFGELHHPGCHNEKCPKCGGQAIACGCSL